MNSNEPIEVICTINGKKYRVMRDESGKIFYNVEGQKYLTVKELKAVGMLMDSLSSEIQEKCNQAIKAKKANDSEQVPDKEQRDSSEQTEDKKKHDQAQEDKKAKKSKQASNKEQVDNPKQLEEDQSEEEQDDEEFISSVIRKMIFGDGKKEKGKETTKEEVKEEAEELVKGKEHKTINTKAGPVSLKTVIGVFALATIGIIAAAQNRNNENGETTEHTKDSRTEQEYDYDTIYNAIEGNYNLGDDERAFLKKFQFVFNENHQYMDIKVVLDRLQNLKFNYTTSSLGLDTQTGGTYSARTNTITIYGASSFYDCSAYTATSQVMKMLQTSSKNDGMLAKLSNELVTREVVRRMNENGMIANTEQFQDLNGECVNYGNGYDYYMPMYYWLAEVLDRQTLQDFQFYPNDKTLINALVKIDGKQGTDQEKSSRKQAEQLIKSVNALGEYKESGRSYTFKRNEIDSIRDQIDYYYVRVHNKKMEECMATQMLDYDLQLYVNKKVKEFEGESINVSLSDQTLKKCIATCDTIYTLAGTKSDYSVDYMGTYLTYRLDYLPRTYLCEGHSEPILSFKHWEYISNHITMLNDNTDRIYLENLGKYRQASAYNEYGETENDEFEIE